jgi:molecular chaperone DnaJ
LGFQAISQWQTKIITIFSASKKTPKRTKLKKRIAKWRANFTRTSIRTIKPAEEKFKEVQEAYDVLSDEKKRKVFDRFGYYNDNLDPEFAVWRERGSVGGNPNAGFDFSGFNFEPGGSGGGSSFRDIFSDFSAARCQISTATRTEPPRPLPKKGADIEMPLALSFEESFTGLTTNITVNRSEQCSRCQGAGDTGGPVVVCPTCKGTGQVSAHGGRLQFSQNVRLRRHRSPSRAVFAVQRQRRHAENRAG